MCCIAAYRVSMTKQRLNKDKWIAAGFVALHRDGPDGLRAEPLARELNTTKGSFYWHFADVVAFQSALLDHWQADALKAIVQELETAGPADERLRRYGRLLYNDKTERALRAWATHDANAQAALDAVDSERLVYIGSLMGQLGLSNPAFTEAAYSSLIGGGFLNGESEGFDALVDVVLALQ
ncbi:hypothetical protein ASD8599_03328 [Ascidiaceihabitans donghaensis]|uniref:HTH tetR-type domain-containing protein n=2 Tax=Ascidiaceihabitans donghaensis TaxID=1510460 RepID=A0A2R8BHN3_9RHOB|nr:hypothetical protein ASD8599_03328 [Ascidiaceihabitans donghaensis]